MDDRIRCVLDYLGYNCIIVNPFPGVEMSIVFLYPDEIGTSWRGWVRHTRGIIPYSCPPLNMEGSIAFFFILVKDKDWVSDHLCIYRKGLTEAEPPKS